MRQLELPRALGPGFLRRLGPGHPPPIQLTEEYAAPDGGALPAGTWVIVYRPIIQ
jgi:hypothetical protein